MTGAKTRQICGPYSGCARPRLWRKVAIAALLAIPLGGCSLSGQLDSFFPSSDKSDRTGTVASSAKEEAQLPPPADLAYARAAASAVLSRGDRGLKHTVGKSAHRNARHGHADRLSLYAGRTDVPRFPRKLCLRQLAILGAGRSMQAAAG